MTRKFTHPNDAPEGHEWRTADGSEVKILLIDDRDKAIIGAYRKSEKSPWVPMSWRAAGFCHVASKTLTYKPETAEGYINIYKYLKSGMFMVSILHPYKADALAAAEVYPGDHFACIKIGAEKGSGL